MADQDINIGGVVNDKVMESIKNMDLMTVLQRMVAHDPQDEESEDIRERLKSVVEQFSKMSPDERESVTKQIKEGLAARISARLNDPDSPLELSGLQDAIREAVVNQLILAGVVVVIILFLLVFFGYKLYKSIKEKEKKKEEKKKAKQQKKKK